MLLLLLPKYASKCLHYVSLLKQAFCMRPMCPVPDHLVSAEPKVQVFTVTVGVPTQAHQNLSVKPNSKRTALAAVNDGGEGKIPAQKVCRMPSA